MQSKTILPKLTSNKVNAAPNDDTIFPSMNELHEQNTKFLELEG